MGLQWRTEKVYDSQKGRRYIEEQEMEDEQNCERHGDSKWALLALHGLKRDIGANNNWLSSE